MENVELDRYQAVNAATTFSELKDAIELCVDHNGYISGRTQSFSLNAQLRGLDNFMTTNGGSPEYMTRNYGIRQQAIYLLDFSLRYEVEI